MWRWKGSRSRRIFTVCEVLHTLVDSGCGESTNRELITVAGVSERLMDGSEGLVFRPIFFIGQILSFEVAQGCAVPVAEAKHQPPPLQCDYRFVQEDRGVHEGDAQGLGRVLGDVATHFVAIADGLDPNSEAVLGDRVPQSG